MNLTANRLYNNMQLQPPAKNILKGNIVIKDTRKYVFLCSIKYGLPQGIFEAFDYFHERDDTQTILHLGDFQDIKSFTDEENEESREIANAMLQFIISCTKKDIGEIKKHLALQGKSIVLGTQS